MPYDESLENGKKFADDIPEHEDYLTTVQRILAGAE